MHQTLLLNWVRLGLRIYLGFNTCHIIGDFVGSSLVGKEAKENGRNARGNTSFYTKDDFSQDRKYYSMFML